MQWPSRRCISMRAIISTNSAGCKVYFDWQPAPPTHLNLRQNKIKGFLMKSFPRPEVALMNYNVASSISYAIPDIFTMTDNVMNQPSISSTFANAQDRFEIY